MRVFISIEPSEHVKSRIFHEFENLQKRNLFKGRFVKKDDLHLTLKFLGEISEEKVNEIKEKLKEVKFEKFECEVGKVGVFNNEKFIKVIWVELKSDKLLELEKKISEIFPELSFDKKFVPHITVARVVSVNNKEELIKAIKKIHFKNLKFEVNEFFLMKSELMKKKIEGSRYKIIERYKLE